MFTSVSCRLRLSVISLFVCSVFDEVLFLQTIHAKKPLSGAYGELYSINRALSDTQEKAPRL